MGAIYTHIHPSDAYRGLRALTTQSYNECNIKLGTQHEASSIFLLVPGSGVLNTLFITGDKPVSLKAREISYSGTGLYAEIFESPTYTGGTGPLGYYNSSAANPVQGEAEIYGEPSVTNEGSLKFAPIYYIGNMSNQGSGSSKVSIGGERILKSNTTYLFRITSLDTGVQNIASFLTWYEGVLDFPLEDGEY